MAELTSAQRAAQSAYDERTKCYHVKQLIPADVGWCVAGHWPGEIGHAPIIGWALIVNDDPENAMEEDVMPVIVDETPTVLFPYTVQFQDCRADVHRQTDCVAVGHRLQVAQLDREARQLDQLQKAMD